MSEPIFLLPGETPPEHDSWTPVNLNTLPDKPPVQPTLGGIGIIYPGKRHVFSGAPESAKTLAGYAILIQVVRAQAAAILIDFEMGGYDARARLRELSATPDEVDRIHYLEPDTAATPPRIQALIQLRPQLVLIDAAAGAYDIQGLDDNKRGDVEEWSRIYVRDFWRAGIATILIDHVVKNSENRGRFQIGSERKLGGADVHLGFETITPISRGTTGHYKIVTHKDRGGYLQRGKLADLYLESHPETHEIKWEFRAAEHTPEDAPFRPTTLMERISVWLHMHNEPASRSQIENAIKGTNAKAKRAAMDVLLAEGFVAEQPGPRGAKLLKNVRIYKKEDPTCNPETEGEMESTSSDLVRPRLPLNQADLLTPSTSSDLVQTGSNEKYDSQDTIPPRLTSSDLVQTGSTSTSSTSSPSLEGQDERDGEVETPPRLEIPDHSWLDELAPDRDDDAEITWAELEQATSELQHRTGSYSTTLEDAVEEARRQRGER